MQSSPFLVTGVGYVEPFLIEDRKGRVFKTFKFDIGVFVCFATKALYIETISSLSLEPFLQALR